jgi:transposase-like protein
LLEEAEDDVLAFYAFPPEHWSKLRSTNPLERFNREIGRRIDLVGIFPDDASVVRLVSMLAIEANDEWLVGRAYISKKSMAEVLSATRDRALTTTDRSGGGARARCGLSSQQPHRRSERTPTPPRRT